MRLACDSPASANELLHKALAEPSGGKVPAAKVDLGKHIFVAEHFAVGVDVDHRPIHLKQRDHFRDIGLDHQRVSFARSLINVGTFGWRSSHVPDNAN